jgi:succinoglycan biosynthesis protein ExoA
MSRELDFSVIIPCRNEVRYLADFLRDLTMQEGLDDLNWEILIADGMSEDGSRELLEDIAARESKIRIIENSGKIVPTGLNEAIELARGEMIIRLDVHSRYASDYLRTCLDVFEETGADNVGGAYRACAEGSMQRAIAAAFASRFAVGGASSHFADYEGWVDTVFLGCWKRSKLIELGMFDENLVRNQDDELNIRLIRSGGRIWQSRAIRVDYFPRNSFRGVFRQYYQYGYYKVAVIRKHRIPTSARHLAPGMLAAGLILPLPLLPFVDGLWMFWALLAGTYLSFLLVGALKIASSAGWDLLPRLPAVLACFHLGYGTGFLQGLLAQVSKGFSPGKRARRARRPEEPQE